MSNLDKGDIRIFSTKTNENISKYDNSQFINPGSISDLINNRLNALNQKPIDLIREVILDQRNGYKYIRGEKKIKRDLALKILISLNFDLNEIQYSLKVYQYPILYPKIKRDFIICTMVKQKADITTINKELASEGEFLL